MFCPTVFPYPVPPIEENVLDEGKLLKPWDTKKVTTYNNNLLLQSFILYLFINININTVCLNLRIIYCISSSNSYCSTVFGRFKVLIYPQTKI